MLSSGLANPVVIAAVILLMDIFSAGIFLIVLQRREHPLAFVIPSAILISGVVAAVAILYFLGGPLSN